MRKIRLLSLCVLVISASLLSQAGCSSQNQSTNPTEPGLLTAQGFSYGEGLIFPFEDYHQVDYFYCFGLYPWSPQGKETHGGIDIVANYDPAATQPVLVPIRAPADGRVVTMLESTSGDGCTTFVVVVQISDNWLVICNFEPQTLDERTMDYQRERIIVSIGQGVTKGQKIGDLVVFNVKPGGSYPHLHYALLYKSPSQSVEWLQNNYLSILVSDGTNLPPTTGPGSPWEPQDLGILSTFFCPYVYSEPNAQRVFDIKPKQAANGDPCTEICAYGSQNGDCGCAQ